MIIRGLKYGVISCITGFSMWVIGGLWHNLILPLISVEAEAHHEGLLLMLISYVVLAGFMVYLFLLLQKHRRGIIAGIETGVIIGILWVFPHGLAIAAAQGSSVSYEVLNTPYHIVEQGLGGIVLYLSFTFLQRKRADTINKS